MNRLCYLLLAALLAASGVGRADTIRVPDDEPTIQNGIDAAAYGDTVLVACGTYYESEIEMKSGVCLTSETGLPDCVTIDAQQEGRVLRCSSDDNRSSLVGITVTGGVDTFGGGMYCSGDASPTIANCIFSGNAAEHGGGMFCYGSSPRLVDVTFTGNESGFGGGGLDSDRSSPTLVRCVFSHNAAYYGGGMYCGYSTPILTNCTFFGNSARGDGSLGAGIYVWDSPAGAPTLENCIIAFSTLGQAVVCDGGGSPTVRCCDVFGNEGGDWGGCIGGQYGVNGNISEDPLLCGNLSPLDPCALRDDSPCAAGTNPECGQIGARGVGCVAPADRLVPDEYATIQAALDDSNPGDTIKVAGGLYEEAIVIPPMRDVRGGFDPTFTIQDADAYPTVIDAAGASDAVTCGPGPPDANPILVEGFEIRNASFVGVRVQDGADADLHDLAIHGCHQGVSVDSPSERTIARAFVDLGVRAGEHEATRAARLSRGELAMVDCAVYGNTGSGVDSDATSTVILNCTIVGNGLDGIAIAGAGAVQSSIVVSNRRHGISASTGSPWVTYSDIWDNGEGDLSGCEAGYGCISEDPMFCDVGSYDLRLDASSPCCWTGMSGQHMGAFGVGCPAGPQSLTVVQDGASLLASWSPPPPGDVIDHYVVYRDTPPMDRVVLATVDAPETTFVDVTIPACVPHGYCVTAVDASGIEGAASNEVITELCYGGPHDLTVAFDEDGNELAWSEAEGPTDRYFIMRSTEVDYPDSIGAVPAGTCTFIDCGEDRCVRENYTYEIVPVYDTGWHGKPSQAVTIDPAPSPPADVVAEWSGNDVVMAWTPNCECDCHRYWIYRDTVPFMPPTNSILLVGFTADTTFVDEGLDPDGVYFYRLTATDASSQRSVYSEIVHLGTGDVLTVPSPYATIQDAIDAASALDTVRVAPGTYDENVVLRDAVSVVATGGPSVTTIRSGAGDVVTATPVVELTRLEGFTVDGLGTAQTGLFSCGSRVRVADCEFRNASAGAAFQYGGTPVLSGNLFAGNQTGIACADSAAPFLEGNTFDGNAMAAVLTNGDPGPVIGGALADANDFLNPGAFQVINASAEELRAEFNYWGDLCVDPAWFSGPVDYIPWTDADHVGTYTECWIAVAEDQTEKPYASLNYPNPFNPSTTIRYTIPSSGGHVRLTVYDLAGRRVRTLVDESRRAGDHHAVWRGRDDGGRELGSGVYFYRLEIGEYRVERKMVMLK